MTRSRTALAVAGLSLLAVLFGTACGGDDDDEGAASETALPSDPAAPPPPPITEVAARADLDPCTLLQDGAAALGLPPEPTDTKVIDAEGTNCTWSVPPRTVVISLYNGNADDAATGLGVTAMAPADIAGQQARQYAEPTGCVLLFSLSGNRTLVIVGAEPGSDNCAVARTVAETAIPAVA